MRLESSEQGCRQIGDKPNEVATVTGSLNWGDLPAGSRGEDPRNVDVGDSRGDMLHRGILKLEDVDVLSRVPDFQDKFLALFVSEVKILISFARQFCGGAFNSIQLGGEGCGLLAVKLGSFSGGCSPSVSIGFEAAMTSVVPGPLF